MYWELFERGFQQAARIDRWKAVRRNWNGPLELHDLARDLGEESDVAGEQPAVVARLEEIFRSGRTDSADYPVRPN